MSRKSSESSKQSGSRAPQGSGVQTQLKSERVQLELQTQDRVRKIVQRGASGRFIEPLVLPADLPALQVSIVVGAGALGEGVVALTAGLVPGLPSLPLGSCTGGAKEVRRA